MQKKLTFVMINLPYGLISEVILIMKFMIFFDTRDGVKLLIKRNTGGSGNLTCYMFVVADALMEILGGSLKSILY